MPAVPTSTSRPILIGRWRPHRRRAVAIALVGLVLVTVGGGGAAAAQSINGVPTPHAVLTPTPVRVPSVGYGWGNGTDGQLASAGAILIAPQLVPLPPDTVALALGREHSVALASDGTVSSWGARTLPELLGAGPTAVGAPAAGQVSVGLPDLHLVGLAAGAVVTAIAADDAHSLALTAEGAVWAWGDNADGQLGDGTTTDRPAPVTISGLPPIAAIATGERHSIAVARDGRVFSWGANEHGQLGDGSTVRRLSPVTVALPAGVLGRSAAAGAVFTALMTSNGALLTWGANQQGQLGDGTRTSRLLPTPVVLPAGVTARSLVAGTAWAAAVTSTDAVMSWGDNTWGQLGDGSTTSRFTPVATALPAGAGIVELSATGNHSVALTSTGAVLTWGSLGHSGDGTAARTTPTVVALPAQEEVSTVEAGFGHDIVVVRSSGLTGIIVSTPTPVVRENEPAVFTATGFDAEGHFLGAVPPTLTVDQGRCEGSSCSGPAGVRIVTATMETAAGPVEATATFESFAAALSGTTGTLPGTGPVDATSAVIYPPATTPAAAAASAGTTSASVRPTTNSSQALTIATTPTRAAGGSLPYTGIGPWIWTAGLIGALLLLVGATLLITTRRPRGGTENSSPAARHAEEVHR